MSAQPVALARVARYCMTCGTETIELDCCGQRVCPECEPFIGSPPEDSSFHFHTLQATDCGEKPDEPSLLDVLCQLDLAREAAVLLEQQTARLTAALAEVRTIANDPSKKQRARLHELRVVAKQALEAVGAL